MFIKFPEFSGKRCLMMPFIQGDPESVPVHLRSGYEDIVEQVVIDAGKVGYLTIDESSVRCGVPQRAAHAKYERALHTEVGVRPDMLCRWGGGWAGRDDVFLNRDTGILVASNMDDTTAVWDAEHENTTRDGDIGHLAHLYPLESARILRAGEVARLGVFTPHESLPVTRDTNRQFLRIVGDGVTGRAPYFTDNPLMH